MKIPLLSKNWEKNKRSILMLVKQYSDNIAKNFDNEFIEGDAMGLVARLKIGFFLLIFVFIWGIITSLLTGIISIPITYLITLGLISANPTGMIQNVMLLQIIVWILFLPLTALFFGLVVPLLPQRWFQENLRKANEMSVFKK
jgi:hypothetical protein